MDVKQTVELNSSAEARVKNVWDHVIVLVVDALKHEFAETDGKNFGLEEPRRLTDLYPSTTKLYKFVADPPTTTLQRLKGLTTGTLPTFIEAGSNFGGSAILEDNLIDQLGNHNKNVVFMGDDTWDSLFPGSARVWLLDVSHLICFSVWYLIRRLLYNSFPGIPQPLALEWFTKLSLEYPLRARGLSWDCYVDRFHRSYPFPSFDVWDLDTVDRGVKQHLFQELEKKDWKLLIAHSLGVDHAGHRYGPQHPEMQRKLQEIDEIIRSTVKALPENSLFLVFGDHGMTANGDHGGDTEDEINAALFAYSNSYTFLNDSGRSIPQVDLVPTLALALGIPIPFANIGKIIRGLTPALVDGHSEYESAVIDNAKQVEKYIETYSSVAPGSLPSAHVEDLQNLYRTITHNCQSTACQRLSAENADAFLGTAQAYFRESWTQFNIHFMITGIALSLLSAFIGCFLEENGSCKKSRLVAVVVAVNFGILWTLYNSILPLIIEIFLTVVGVAWGTAVILKGVKATKQISPCDLPTLVTALFPTLVFFSNSLIVDEPAVLRYCLSSFILYTKLSEARHRLLNGVTAVICSALVQANRYFEHCREENGPECVNFDIFKPLSSVTGHDSIASQRLILAVTSVAIFVLMLRSRRAVARKFLYFNSACLVLYWWSEYSSLLQGSVSLLATNLIFVSSLVHLLTVRMKGDDVVQVGAITTMLLIGDGLAPSIVSMLLIVHLWKKGKSLNPESVEATAFVLMLIWHIFFCGRNATFSSIQWNAAFVGSWGARDQANEKSLLFDFLFPLVKVGIATFGSHIICGLAASCMLSCSPSRFVGFSALRVSFSMLACAILRRHLMMWKIFAPRFVFEGIGMIVSCLVFMLASFVTSVK